MSPSFLHKEDTLFKTLNSEIVYPVLDTSSLPPIPLKSYPVQQKTLKKQIV